jgi:ATP-dependent Lhr-like helicase
VVSDDALAPFSPATRAWFTGAFAAPTEAQRGVWQAVAAGQHALVDAPTGSGKTPRPRQGRVVPRVAGVMG